METATLAAVFFGVWLVLLFGYCVFKLCGGKLVDVFSCDCCGPCWGNGGRIDELDYEYPFADIDPDAIRRRRAREDRAASQLPPIVVVSKNEVGAEESESESEVSEDVSPEITDVSDGILYSSRSKAKPGRALRIV